VPWAWFFTGTFSRPTRSLGAERAGLRWLRQVSRRALGGRAGRERIVRAVLSVERHRSGAAHIHAVVADVDGLPLREGVDLWKARYGVCARITPFDPGRRGLPYVLKNVDQGASIFVSREVFTDPVE
jgi:hypothetical protein